MGTGVLRRSTAARWEFMMPERGRRMIWTALGALALIAIAGMWVAGMAVRLWPLALIAFATITLLGIALVYGITGRSAAISRAAEAGAILILFWLCSATLSYAVATTRVPLADSTLAAADRALGFDWAAWSAWVHSHPPVHVTLTIAYAALMPIALVSLLGLALLSSAAELLVSAILAAVITIALSGIVPALGNIPTAPWVTDILAARSGSLRIVPFPNAQGLVSFPSFHVALAFIVAAALRRTPVAWLGVLLLFLTVLAVPTEGGHYMIDVIAGAVVALVSVYATRALLSTGAPVPRQ